MTSPDYMQIVNHYETCLKQHGATPQGLDWPNLPDVHKRFKVMLGITDTLKGKRLLDLGCGYGLLVDYLKEHQIPLEYHGIDLSPLMVEEARKRHPGYCFGAQDILAQPLTEEYDFILMNGLLTVKSTLSHAQMEHFATSILKAAFAHCRTGMAFNVMSAQVDWKRDDLFHWPFDAAAQFIRTNLSRHFAFRQDYGLYEYTVYVYKDAHA
jgi:SAM-dependent methyltransferase